jgi:hypothetical protein
MKFKYLLLLFPVCLILALGGAELYFRSTSERSFSTLNGRWLEPYLGFGNFKGDRPITPPSSAGYKSDGLIYRWQAETQLKSVQGRAPATFGEEYPSSGERAPDKKWVVVMGGSAAMGDGSWPKRFPGLLQEQLEKKYPGLQVFTAATRAFVSTQERVALELYVLPLRPEAVVFLHGFNDMNQTYSMARPGDPYNMGVTYARYESPWFGFLQLVSDHSRLAERFLANSVLQTMIDGRHEITKTARGVFTRSAAAIYEDNVRRMARRCEQEKVRCLFILQPFRDFDDDFGEESVRMTYQIVAEAFKKDPLKGMATFHDFALAFAEKEELFVDEVHMGEAGQTQVAQEAAALLGKSGLSSGSRANP